MAASNTGSISEAQISARLPLLMDHSSSSSNTDHVVNIDPNEHYESDSSALPSSSTQTEHVLLDLHAIDDQRLPMGPSPPPPTGRMDSFGRHNTEGSNYGAHQRTSPLNSGLWVSIELIVTVSQIVASAIVLSLSRGEKPQAPLSVWVLGYATGCLATLPLLYWRYKHCNGLPQRERDSLTLSSSSSSSISPRATHVPILAQDEDTEPGASSQTVIGNSRRSDLRVGLFVERFKIALDCFFAVWFVVGNVWVFGGHSSSSEAPNLYRLCIVFLTFSCIGYAMPFILCATLCCCLPCIIRIIGTSEDEGRARGAPTETIEGLPKCNFKTLAKASKGSRKGKKEGKGFDIETPGEGGFVFAGMEKERPVSADDAVCCICLGKYRDGAELRELPCTHFFHVECVDKWLKINASCPLCKNEIGTSGDQITQGSR